MNFLIARNLLASEFACTKGECPHCKGGMAHVRWLNAWERLRPVVGPTIVTNGYRCPIHNAEVGGAEDSEHLRGTAGDLVFPKSFNPETPEALKLFLICGFRGIGRGMASGAVHLDVREGPPTFWRYRKGERGQDRDEVAFRQFRAMGLVL